MVYCSQNYLYINVNKFKHNLEIDNKKYMIFNYFGNIRFGGVNVRFQDKQLMFYYL